MWALIPLCLSIIFIIPVWVLEKILNNERFTNIRVFSISPSFLQLFSWPRIFLYALQSLASDHGLTFSSGKGCQSSHPSSSSLEICVWCLTWSMMMKPATKLARNNTCCEEMLYGIGLLTCFFTFGFIGFYFFALIETSAFDFNYFKANYWIVSYSISFYFSS